MTEVPEATSLGEALRLARVASGFSQDSLARELRLPVTLLQAIEAEEWHRIPPGRERPLTRLLARRLGLDLARFEEAFEALPGGQGQAPPDPRRERLERILTTIISLASLTLLAWLVVPGKDLRERMPARVQIPSPPVPTTPSRINLPAFTGPYPVLGEVLPEAPVTPEGILVSLRAMDTCEAQITGESADLHHSMRISEPWIVRAKGPFTLSLDNAGVVMVEVAGRRIQHGRSVGEPWSATFGADGMMQLTRETPPEGTPPAPDTDSEANSGKSEE
jgi:transcriptional regulator with XRE-family HTH domain